MVTVPAEGRWGVRLLADEDVKPTLAFLRREPLINIYLISRLLEEKTAAATQVVEVRYNRELVLVASLATNIVIAADPHTRRDLVDSAIAIVADRIVSRVIPVRAIISPSDLVDTLWKHLRRTIDPPTVVRMNQPVYAIKRNVAFPDLEAARYSTLKDIDLLVPACAAMHKEEVGIDPLERDAAGYRERIRELIERKRSIVRIENGRIASKCEFSAVTDEAVQLMGVWTDPVFRRRGLARKTLREVCGHLFRRGKHVTLFVNDFNTAAISLYESLGFERIGVNRALIW